jgi:hypothetical protein
MDVVLQTNTANPAFALRDIRWFSDGSGYSSEYVVHSGGFSAARPFHFEAHPLRTFLNSLEAMDRDLRGSAELKPMFESDFVRLTLDHSGHLEVAGELTEQAHRRQSLVFSFQTDQTCLKPLIKEIGDVLGLQQESSRQDAPRS